MALVFGSALGHDANSPLGVDVDMLGALDAAADEFGQRLELVNHPDWSRPTPCSEWDVRYLAAHVIGGNRFAVDVLGGVPATKAIERVMSCEQIGDDALAAWTSTIVAQASAFRSDNVLKRLIDHPLGAISGRQFLELRVFDITLHAWDLARAIGADDRLDPDLAAVVLQIVENGPPGMGFGIAALGQVRPDESAQSRLLNLSGRSVG